jgi:amidase
MTDLATLDAVEQADLVRRGEATAGELVEAAIERIEAVNGVLNAVIHPLYDRARERVRAGLPAGPFHGVPILVKDLDGALAGAPLHKGNRALAEAGHVASTTSHLFRRLEDAGFVIVGKTNTPEFGLLPTSEPAAKGPTRNPWHLDHSAGGSSGGSAAAVAAGMVAVAHAGDGGGSIRIPASMCGIFGLKPSRARVSLGPAEGEDWGGLVQRHVVTRTVRDSAAVLDVLAGPETGDPYTAPPPARPFASEVGADPGRLRVGVRIDAIRGLAETDPVCAAATERLAALLVEAGHHVEPSSPAALDEADVVLGSFTTLNFSHTLANLRAVSAMVGRELGPDDVEPMTWAQAEAAKAMTGADYIAARDAMFTWSRRVVSWWDDEGFDLLVTPTCAAPPPLLGELRSTPDDPLAALGRAVPYGVFTVPFNMTGQPAMSVPVDWTDAGLPIGVQVVAAPWREDLLLRLAAQLEQALGWPARRPPVFSG